MNSDEKKLRQSLGSALRLQGAHIAPESIVAAFRPEERGVVPPGFTSSAYQLLAHLRLALQDQRDYCTKPDYRHEWKWPDDYWPKSKEPGSGAWEREWQSYQSLVEEFAALAMSADLLSPVPRAEKPDHTLLRGILMMADHGAYHFGQMVSLGKAIGVAFEKV